LAQNQPKSYFLFHKNVQPFYIMTLIETNAENANFRLSFNIGLHIGRDEMCINSDKDD
jgi:hypothetical protein